MANLESESDIPQEAKDFKAPDDNAEAKGVPNQAAGEQVDASGREQKTWGQRAFETKSQFTKDSLQNTWQHDTELEAQLRAELADLAKEAIDEEFKNEGYTDLTLDELKAAMEVRAHAKDPTPMSKRWQDWEKRGADANGDPITGEARKRWYSDEAELMYNQAMDSERANRFTELYNQKLEEKYPIKK